MLSWFAMTSGFGKPVHLAPHRSVVVLGGGMALTLALPRATVEVCNDANGGLVRFFRCALFHPAAHPAELDFIPTSREDFHAFRAQPGLTDIQAAARWFHRNKTCFGGANMDAFGVSVVSSGGATSAARRFTGASQPRMPG